VVGGFAKPTAGWPREAALRLQVRKDAALPVQKLTVMMTQYGQMEFQAGTAGLKLLFRRIDPPFPWLRHRHRPSRPRRPAGQADPLDSSTTLLCPSAWRGMCGACLFVSTSSARFRPLTFGRVVPSGRCGASGTQSFARCRRWAGSHQRRTSDFPCSWGQLAVKDVLHCIY